MSIRAKKNNIIEPWSIWVACIILGAMITAMALRAMPASHCNESEETAFEKLYGMR